MRGSLSSIRVAARVVLPACLLTQLLIAGIAQAAAGDLDTSFDGDGKVITSLTGGAWGTAVAIQADQKILVTGYGGAIGTRDIAGGDDYARDVATQTSGTILAAGETIQGGIGDFVLVRYASSGTLDLTFGTGGTVLTDFGGSDDAARGIAVQTNGRILVGGIAGADFGLVRYKSNGRIDKSFGVGGKVTTDFGTTADAGRGLILQTDGRIVMGGNAGDDFGLARYEATGALDASFGAGGVVVTDLGLGQIDHSRAIALQSDGKIVAAGYTRAGGDQTSDFAVARYDTAGTLDSTFGTGGIVITDFGGTELGRSVVVQADGMIVVAGSIDRDEALVRYNADGSLDTSFGAGGLVRTDFGGNDGGRDVALQADGDIVTTGEIGSGLGTSFTVARYLAI
jgi:uncharacterized delta-60 repeat protein